MSLTVSLLGPLQVTDGEGRMAAVAGYKARCLLVILTLARGTVVTADRLIDELWDGCPPPQPEASFHAYVCRLRRALAASDGDGPGPIITRKPGYELVWVGLDVDVDRFERLADAARVALADGEPTAAGAHAQRALALWRGPALVDFRDRSFATLEALRLEELRRAVIEDGIDAALMLGQHGSLVAELDRLVAEHPFRERLHGQRMLALYRSGRQADALRAYRQAAGVLLDELGVTPGPALRELEAAILRHDPGLRGDHAAGDLVGAAQRAVRHAATLWVRAGDEAMAGSGFKDAAYRYEAAIGALACADEPDLQGRAVLALGDARHADYDRVGARVAYLDAARRAVAAGDRDALGRATWGLTAVTEFAGTDPEAAEVLTVAMQELGAGDVCLRARLLAALARTAPAADCGAREQIGEAVELARRHGDTATLAVTVSTWCLVSWGPDGLAERERHIDESIGLAEDLGWTELAMEARNWLSATAWEAGDGARADVELARVVHWQRDANRPFFRCLTALRHGASLLRRGEYAAAQANLDTMPVAAHASPDFLAGFASQLFALRRDQGRLAELEGLIDGHVREPAAAPAWAAAAAVTQLALGRRHEARTTLNRLLADHDSVPRDWLWLAAMTHLADVAVGLDDAPAAARLLRILRPYAQRQVVLAHGILTTGSAARSVAELASLLGEHAEAETWFTQALDADDRRDCQPWLARTRYAFARHLRRVGDERGATDMHGRALGLARRLGTALT